MLNDCLIVHSSTLHLASSLSSYKERCVQLCHACGTHADWIICLVEESIIEPQGEDMRLWRFSGESMVRARSALRLQRDLGINLAGIALVLDLMEELESLRAQKNQI